MYIILNVGIIRNDTVIGDPLYTVPYYNASKPEGRQNLCYEIHGRSNHNFNLISDKCASVNAHYSAVGSLNIISAIAIRAEDNEGRCRDILVNLERCSVSTGLGSAALTAVEEMISVAGISVRKRSADRARVSLPNCEGVNLIMWVICERGAIDMIRFQIARGVNLRPTSHGLLGKYYYLYIESCV